MGDHNIKEQANDEARIVFINHLLDDLKSLDHMLKTNMVEDDIVRIGAEQEFCLVNDQWRPSANSLDILKDIDDEHFTTELALYNVEINLDPIELSGDAFKQVENQLSTLMNRAKESANKHNTKIVLTGILPSISKHELEMEFMTPAPRYYALNDRLKTALGGDFRMHLTGVDELSITHDSVMFEACNTSFQMHLQISPQDFASSYNWSQAIAGPVLGACVNSPLLLGNELWSETRIALFQQSVDTRKLSRAKKDQQPRVTFGENWISGSILDFYKNEISKYRIILTKEIENNSFEELEKGIVPKLRALNLHNGTIYRWNRPCYGVGGGKPHIRIENRYIPAGPSISDEMANFAFWVGLMKGRPADCDILDDKMDFADAKSNFVKAARNGSDTIMDWMGEKIPLNILITDKLLPIARQGLEKMSIDPKDIETYLTIIENRIAKHTGSEWITKNYRHLKKNMKSDDALVALTESMYTNQQKYKSLNEWPSNIDSSLFDSKAKKNGHIMSTAVLSAAETDSALLTLQFMKWNDIHHLPILDKDEKLVGLITWKHLAEHLDQEKSEINAVQAGGIMIKNVITSNTTTPIDESSALMQENEIGCLPIIQDGQLVGIVTKKDLI